VSISRWLVSAIFVGAVVAGSACTQEPVKNTTDIAVVAADKVNAGADQALEATNRAGEKTADATKNAAETIGDKTKEITEKTVNKTEDIGRAVARETKDVVSTTGEVITDTWITARVSAKFVDEALLKGSNINVDTTEHTVTLKGTVKSDAAKARAAAIAGETEGVKHVVNQLVVRA
jgi:hyperosmotically inducible periplasmic protein